jgi:tetratricopeptide (TPR) repeat protein
MPSSSSGSLAHALDADASARGGGSQQLLAESSEDLGRLSALVAVLSQQSTSTSTIAKVEMPEAEAASSQTDGTTASLAWWVWAAAGVAALIVTAVVRFGIHDPGPEEALKKALAANQTEVKTVPPVKQEPVRPVVTQPVVTRPVVMQPVVTPPQTVAADPAEVKRVSKLYLGGKSKEALAAIEAVLAAAPTDAQALLLKANILVERKELTGAKQAAQAAITSDAGLAEAYMALGVIEQEAGQKDAALAAYEKFLALAPKDRYAASIRQQVKALRRGR